MNIIVNGEKLEVENNAKIADVLHILGVEQKVVAIALNTQIVKKDLWHEESLKENDELELLWFVSGG